MLPESRTERRMGQQAMQAAEPIKGELKNAGREVVEHLQQVDSGSSGANSTIVTRPRACDAGAGAVVAAA